MEKSWRAGCEPSPAQGCAVCVTTWTRRRPPKEHTPVTMGSVYGAAGQDGCGVRLSGRNAPTCAEIARRLERPHRQATGAPNAKCSQPSCSAAPHREQRIASSAKWTAGPSTRAEDACQYAVGTSRQKIALEGAPRPGGQGVRRRELSRSYLAGRRSRPDRREGCQAPCPPIRGT